ncbi:MULTISPECIES: single-stranded DNA-binding protein [unclassified Microbacterium]|uniref:single-stranded DNA-binding protein n=1 Tax=unclassified Microbacterium TaxID=2609290 RepID=UPI00214C123B|nr:MULTISPECIES: single-stranded DNA-binding protein [unclassified Microbacterium]MCR2785480.1 single-stranded DNA-binding protein [Microbacterium sp. zg.B96]WIM17528.1 single-stranded DNA-binding protein [Microbacterium sp. zg-B96]
MSESITVTGNLAADPERRATAGGDTIVAFRVGSTQRRYDKESNTWVDAYTNWYHVSAFRGLAEHALRSLRKGDRVIVTGTLRLRTWENESRSGVTADIDAYAVGPDLRWGTTVFTRAARPGESGGPGESGEAGDPGEQRPASDAPPAAVDANGWSLPTGTDTTSVGLGQGPLPAGAPATQGHTPGDDAQSLEERQLAWAGAGGDEPPF